MVFYIKHLSSLGVLSRRARGRGVRGVACRGTCRVSLGCWCSQQSSVVGKQSKKTLFDIFGHYIEGYMTPFDTIWSVK